MGAQGGGGRLDLFQEAIALGCVEQGQPRLRPAPAATPPAPGRRRAGGTNAPDGIPARPGSPGRSSPGQSRRQRVPRRRRRPGREATAALDRPRAGTARRGCGAGRAEQDGQPGGPAVAWAHRMHGPCRAGSRGRRRAGAGPGHRGWTGRSGRARGARPNRSRGWRMKYWSSGLSRAIKTDRAWRAPRPAGRPAAIGWRRAGVANQQRGVQVADVDAQLEAEVAVTPRRFPPGRRPCSMSRRSSAR